MHNEFIKTQKLKETKVVKLKNVRDQIFAGKT